MFDKASELNPLDANVYLNRGLIILLWLGISYFSLGDYQKAIE